MGPILVSLLNTKELNGDSKLGTRDKVSPVERCIRESEAAVRTARLNPKHRIVTQKDSEVLMLPGIF